MSSEDVQYLWLPLATPSARCSRPFSFQPALPRRSTAGPTRSSRTSPWSGPPSWRAPRGSSRRCARRSCRRSPRRAGSGRAAHLGLRDRRRAPRPAGGPARPRWSRRSRSRRPAGPLDHPGPARRPDPVPRLRQRGPVDRRRPVVPRRGTADPGGLRLTEPAQRLHEPAGELRFGSVGPPFPGPSQVADDGEIFVRGPGVMGATATCLTYRRGPPRRRLVRDRRLGEIDDHGRLRITDRKKDLTKTSGGVLRLAQPIEVDVQGAVPPGERDDRPRRPPQLRDRADHPRPRALTQWGARRACPGPTTWRLPADPAVHAYVDCRGGAERPAEPLGDDQGLSDTGPRPVRGGRELTPSLKVSARSGVAVHAAVDSMYDEQRHG